MTVDPRRRQQLYDAFNAELEERARAVNDLLLRLEHGDEGDAALPAILNALFREAHNLKGAARAVDLPRVEQLAHALEFDSCRGASRWSSSARSLVRCRLSWCRCTHALGQ